MNADMDDVLGHSRLQDWIVDQYQWLDSEPEVDQQLQQPSLRESSLLPSDFDPFVLPTPELPVDEHEHLVQEMNAWKMPGSSRNKVSGCLHFSRHRRASAHVRMFVFSH